MSPSHRLPEGAAQTALTVFQRVRALPDVAAATLDAGFPTFVGALPSDPPPTSGTAWNNAGAPVLTR